MKVKLLKKLRRKGRNKITIHSVTKTDGNITGMKYGFDEDEYNDLFDFGDTVDSVLKKAEHIYIEKYLEALKKK
jgi:hypothetical protein